MWYGDVPSLCSRWVLAVVSGLTGWLLSPPKLPGPRVLSCVLFVAKFSPRPLSSSGICESTLEKGLMRAPSVPIGPFKPPMSNLTSLVATQSTQRPDRPGDYVLHKLRPGLKN